MKLGLPLKRSGPAGQTAAGSRAVGVLLSQRAFLKALAAAVGGVGVAQLAAGGQLAEATYTPGTPSDTVDTNLTVQGNLVVTAPNKVGIGTATPQGTLDVAGNIYINGSEAIGTNGVIKQSYYAP